MPKPTYTCESCGKKADEYHECDYKPKEESWEEDFKILCKFIGTSKEQYETLLDNIKSLVQETHTKAIKGERKKHEEELEKVNRLLILESELRDKDVIELLDTNKKLKKKRIKEVLKGERQRIIHQIREEERNKAIKEAIDLSDKIESEHETTMEEWRGFKHFRNKLRDKLNQ